MGYIWYNDNNIERDFFFTGPVATNTLSPALSANIFICLMPHFLSLKVSFEPRKAVDETEECWATVDTTCKFSLNQQEWSALSRQSKALESQAHPIPPSSSAVGTKPLSEGPRGTWQQIWWQLLPRDNQEQAGCELEAGTGGALLATHLLLAPFSSRRSWGNKSDHTAHALQIVVRDGLWVDVQLPEDLGKIMLAASLSFGFFGTSITWEFRHRSRSMTQGNVFRKSHILNCMLSDQIVEQTLWQCSRCLCWCIGSKKRELLRKIKPT